LPGSPPEEAAARRSAITDGELYDGHPQVGFMIADGSTSCSGNLNGGICTVTLVGRRTVLTAAHCILPGKTHIVCFGGVTYQPQDLIQHPSFDLGTVRNDIGLVILNKEPPITPAVISRAAPTPGLEVTLVGYGITAIGMDDAGVKRIAVNHVKEVWDTRFSFAGTGGGTGSTCNGDSGGPAFASPDGHEVQVGVTSTAVKDQPCGTLAFDTRVDAYAEWLEQASQGDLFSGDAVPPEVSITSPAEADEVGEMVIVRVEASDDVGVTEVECHVDALRVGTLSQGPYVFEVELQPGDHAIRVVARDAQGNAAEATVNVTSVAGLGPGAGEFGDSCATDGQCASALCRSIGERQFCTEPCDPVAPACLGGAECVDVGGAEFVCGEPTMPLGGQILTGGCSAARLPASGYQPGAVLLPVLMLGLLLSLRRRSR
jgi:hypothetical protein